MLAREGGADARDDTMTEQEHIEAIEQMGVRELLRLNRFEPSGSPWFTGAIGDRATARLSELRSQDPAAYTAASKSIGW